MNKITFNPVLITRKLINPLEKRMGDILIGRFGLQSKPPRTLESIGQDYGITRERVRQIQDFVLNKIRQSDEFSLLTDVFEELADRIIENGGLVHEEDFLSSIAKKDEHKPHIHFLLVIGKDFEKVKENDDFCHSWTTDSERANNIKVAFRKFHNEIDNQILLSEKEIVSLFKKYLEEVLEEKIDGEILPSLLRISRVVAPNALGEWGLASSAHIKPRGMRDFAFLVMRRHGSPMHFSEVAKVIEETFNRPAHIQTVHNEVIKDPKFVLVGRGLYALKEWGYADGVVRNVVEKILSESGPLSKEEIIKKVLKERYVKENTILVNLQNRDYFKKDTQGNYTLIC